MLRSTLAVAVALALTAGAASSAQAAGAVREACRADFQKLCSNLPDGEKPRQCMRQHLSQLSDTCRDALAKAKAARDANKTSGGNAG